MMSDESMMILLKEKEVRAFFNYLVRKHFGCVSITDNIDLRNINQEEFEKRHMLLDIKQDILDNYPDIYKILVKDAKIRRESNATRRRYE